MRGAKRVVQSAVWMADTSVVNLVDAWAEQWVEQTARE